MNDETNPWAWWQAALAGKFGPIHEGEPRQGFFRVKDDPVAIWRADDGAMIATRAGRPVDAIDVWTWCCKKPVSHEAYTDAMAGKGWPEDVTAEVEKARAEAPAIGHNSGAEHEVILDELAALDRAWTDWLSSIGGKIATEAQDAKAETFKTRFAEIQKRADLAHKAEKAPILAAGKAVDDKWRVPRDRGDAGKRAVGAALTPYRVARDEARREAERKAKLEAAQTGASPPAEPSRPVKTGLRTVRVTVVTDIRAALAYLVEATPDHPDLHETVRVIARRIIDAGTPVPGVEVREEKRA